MGTVRSPGTRPSPSSCYAWRLWWSWWGSSERPALLVFGSRLWWLGERLFLGTRAACRGQGTGQGYGTRRRGVLCGGSLLREPTVKCSAERPANANRFTRWIPDPDSQG